MPWATLTTLFCLWVLSPGQTVYAQTQNTTGGAPAPSPQMSDIPLDPLTQKKVDDSVPVASQEEAFKQCAEVTSAYGTYFLSADKGASEGNKLEYKKAIEECLKDPNCTSKPKFIQALSIIARAKDIRRTLITCDTEGFNLRSATPFAAGRDIRGFNLTANQSTANKDKDARILGAKNWQKTAGFGEFRVDPNEKIFSFNPDVVMAIKKVNLQTKLQQAKVGRDFGKELQDYLGNFALPAMGIAQANAPGRAIASLTPGSNTLAPLQYDLHTHIEKISTGEGREYVYDVIDYPGTPGAARNPSSTGASIDPTSKMSLTQSAVDQSPAVQRVVDTYLAKLNNNPADPTEILKNDNADPNAITAVNQKIESFVTEKRQELQKKGMDTSKVRILVTQSEANFRDFINDIWPSPQATQP